MPYSSDSIDKEIDFHFRFKGESYYFFARNIEAKLPITEGEAFWGQTTLKARKKVVGVVIQLISLPITLWILWQFFFLNSSLLVFLWWIPLLILSVVFHVIATKSVVRPFELRLFEHLGWQKIGFKKSFLQLATMFPKTIPAIVMWAILLFRWATGYFGLIKWNTLSSVDLQGVLIGIGCFAVISLFVVGTARSYAPPEELG